MSDNDHSSCVPPSTLEQLSKRLDETGKRVDAIYNEWKAWVDEQRSKSKQKDDLVKAIIEKTLAGAVWALVAYAASHLWDYFKHFIKN